MLSESQHLVHFLALHVPAFLGQPNCLTTSKQSVRHIFVTQCKPCLPSSCLSLPSLIATSGSNRALNYALDNRGNANGEKREIGFIYLLDRSGVWVLVERRKEVVEDVSGNLAVKFALLQ